MPKAITSCILRPYYERDHLCHWEVLLNPIQIRTGQQSRSGHIQCEDLAMFNEEHQAHDFVRGLKAQNPELVELALVPSNCPHATNMEAQQ